jgi:acyl-CoA thioesterase I
MPASITPANRGGKAHMTNTCDPHPDLVKLARPLTHLAQSLMSQRKTRIVAIGSSSTAGEGDVIPYPHRLELALRKRFPDRMIDVVNRGIGGQEAPEELARFESDVFAEEPALVLWQIGTNAIYHRELYDPHGVAATIETGLGWLEAREIEVILMDLQYAPQLLTGKEADTRLMVSLITNAANRAGVNVFRRFALMEQWVKDGIDLGLLISSDGLHQTELATACVTAALDAAMGEAIGRVSAAAG